jgi:hypothetical protein
MPRVIHYAIDHSIKVLVQDVFDPFLAPVKKLLEFLRNRRAILRGRNLAGGNGNDTDLFVSVNGSAQKFLDGRLHALWQLTGLLNRNILHVVKLPVFNLINHGGSTLTAMGSLARTRIVVSRTIFTGADDTRSERFSWPR